MVAIVTDETIRSELDDIVCPTCGKPPTSASVGRATGGRCGPHRRRYYGWCNGCNRGCEVEQFWAAGSWRIARYRRYEAMGPRQTRRGPWVEACRIEPGAPIVVGPGGDYDNAVTPGISDLARDLAVTWRVLVWAIRRRLRRRTDG